jgi:serine/threonine protein kinase
MGVILYEFLTGKVPSDKADVTGVYSELKLLVSGYKQFFWPNNRFLRFFEKKEESISPPEVTWIGHDVWEANCNEYTASLIKQLLTVNPAKRLRAADVKNHTWCQSFDWPLVEKNPAPDRFGFINKKLFI